MLIFVLFLCAGVLFGGAFSLSVSLIGIEMAVREVIEKEAADIHQYNDSSKVNSEKKTDKEILQKRIKTFSE